MKQSTQKIITEKRKPAQVLQSMLAVAVRQGNVAIINALLSLLASWQAQEAA